MTSNYLPKRFWASLALLSLCLGLRLYQRYWSPNLVVTFFDVGQGDSALIQFPLGQTMLIDAGGGWKNWDMGTQVLFPELTRLGVLNIDRLLVSHPDNDHAYGVLGILKKFRVRELWLHGELRNRSHRKKIVEEIEKESKFRGTREQWVDSAYEEVISGVSFRVIPLGGNSKKENDKALVALLEMGRCRLLFTGDIEKLGELDLLKVLNSKIHLLKVPHHGSLSSSQWKFLKDLAPKWAVVSVGLKNTYGHPRNEVLSRYRALGIDLFRTDFHGAVRFTFSPQGEVKCETYLGSCGVGICD